MLCILCMFTNVFAAENFTPTWKWQVGADRVYSLKLERKQRVEARGEFETSLDMEAELQLRCLERRADEYLLLLRFQNLKIERHAGSLHSRYISDQDSQSSNGPSLWELAGETLITAEMKILMDVGGGVQVLDGFDDALAAVLDDSRHTDGRAAFEIENLFGSKGFGNLLDNCFSVLPNRQIEVGDNWEKTRRVELAPGMVVQRNERFSLKSLEPGEEMKMEMTGGVEFVGDSGKGIELPNGSARVEMQENGFEGEIRFSIDDGCIAHQSRKGVLNLKTILIGEDGERKKQIVYSHLEQRLELSLQKPMKDGS